MSRPFPRVEKQLFLIETVGARMERPAGHAGTLPEAAANPIHCAAGRSMTAPTFFFWQN